MLCYVFLANTVRKECQFILQWNFCKKEPTFPIEIQKCTFCRVLEIDLATNSSSHFVIHCSVELSLREPNSSTDHALLPTSIHFM